jgi:hypothetical protein
MSRRFIAVAALMLAAGCGGRAAVPIQVTQASDYQLSCEQIAAEQNAIVAKVNALRAEDEAAHNSNIALGVVGAVLFWPALFALDTNETQQQEIGLYRSRSEHLNIVAGQKGCLGASAPTLTTMNPAPVGGATPAAVAEPAAAAFAPAGPATTPAAATPEGTGTDCVWNAQEHHFDC